MGELRCVLAKDGQVGLEVLLVRLELINALQIAIRRASG